MPETRNLKQCNGGFEMSWEKPKAKDISLAMECSSYSNADDFGVEEAPTDPSFDF
jgi:hypothetical protein